MYLEAEKTSASIVTGSVPGSLYTGRCSTMSVHL